MRLEKGREREKIDGGKERYKMIERERESEREIQNDRWRERERG